MPIEEDVCKSIECIGSGIFKEMPQILSLLAMEDLPLYVKAQMNNLFYLNQEEASRSLCQTLNKESSEQLLLTAIEILSELERFDELKNKELVNQTLSEMLQGDPQQSEEVIAAAQQLLNQLIPAETSD